MTAIRIEALTRTFGPVRAVDDISLRIGDGEFFTLLGPSGCGKTTLLRMIAGFCDVERGAIWFDDRRIDTLPAHRRDIGMVFQNYAVFPNLTVDGNVGYGLRARRLPQADIARRVAAALERVRLGGYGARWPHQLSGGQLQRVAIARSLVIEPAVLLFDEPLSNLDAKLRVEMRVEIRQIQQSLGLTAVYVTHDQEEALAISDRIAVLRDGRIEQVGTPETIYQSPATAFVAEFLGTTNMLAGIAASAGRILVGQTELHTAGPAMAPGTHVLVSIRPEMLRPASPEDRPVLTAKLRLREFLGPVVRLHLDLPDGRPLRVSLLSGAAVGGDGDIALTYDPAQVQVFPAP
jgi:iron(III) transport system ATP-binding protein/putative spermidine/putrescine transport system ATP-binding protein